MSNKRSCLPLWNKYDNVVSINSLNGTKVAKLARGFDNSTTTLTTVLKNNGKIISDYEAGRSSVTVRDNPDQRTLSILARLRHLTKLFFFSLSHFGHLPQLAITLLTNPHFRTSLLKWLNFVGHLKKIGPRPKNLGTKTSFQERFIVVRLHQRFAYSRGGEPASRVNIWYGPHQNFHYSI